MKYVRVDRILAVSTGLLLTLGITILNSVAPNLITQQTTIMTIAILISLLLINTKYQAIENFSWGWYAIAVILLGITFAIGQATRGSIRWIPLGPFRLQTSEIAKPLLIIFFSKYSNDHPPYGLKQIFFSLVLLSIPALLIFRQPDLGSTLVLISLWIGIMFQAGTPLKYFVIGTLLLGALIPVSWRFLADYQKSRLTTFINPLNDPLESGYHLMQSIIAVGSGQLLGKGLGQGTQSQLRFLPESHTDFIFASLAEELGLVGTLLLIGLLTLLLVRILIIGQNAPDRFGRLICVGVFAMLSFQAFINIGMNIGLVPITGITLPFVSYGGSSLLSVIISVGLVASIAAQGHKQTLFEIR